MATGNIGIATSIIGLVDFTTKRIDKLAVRSHNFPDNKEKIKNTTRDCEYVREELHKLDEDLREKQIKIREDLQADFHAQIANVEEAFKKATDDLKTLDKLFPSEEQSSISARLVRVITKMRRIYRMNTYAPHIEALARSISDARSAASKLASFVCPCDHIQHVPKDDDKEGGHDKNATDLLSNGTDDVMTVTTGDTSPHSKIENTVVHVKEAHVDSQAGDVKASQPKVKPVAVDPAGIRDSLEASSLITSHPKVGNIAVDAKEIHVDSPTEDTKASQPQIESLVVDAEGVGDKLEAASVTKPRSKVGNIAAVAKEILVNSQANDAKPPQPQVEPVAVDAAGIRDNFEPGTVIRPHPKVGNTAVQAKETREDSQAGGDEVPKPQVGPVAVDAAGIRDNFEPGTVTRPHPEVGNTAVQAKETREDSQAGNAEVPQPKVEPVGIDAGGLRVNLKQSSVTRPHPEVGHTVVRGAAIQENLQAGNGSLSDSLKRKFKRKLKRDAKEGSDRKESRSSVIRQKIKADPFLASVVASLQIADQWAEKRGLRLQNGQNLLCTQLFASLAVLRPRTQVSRTLLKRLWRLSDDDLVHEVTGKLAELNLVTMDRGKGTEYVVSLDEPELRFCQLQAGDRLRKYHRDLLDEYFQSDSDAITLESATRVEYSHLQPGNKKAYLRTWWTATNDRYIHENVCRHLAAGGCISELVALLLHARWTKFRSACGGLLSWENDFQYVIDALQKMHESGASKHKVMNLLEGLKLVRQAVQESWQFITKNPRELAFQTHARLCDSSSEKWPVSSYLESTREITGEPWVKPMRRYWPLSDKALSTEVFRGGLVSSIALANDMVLAAAVESEVLVFNMDTRTILQRLRGHKCEVKSVAMSQDGTRLASVSNDGTLLLWNRESKDSFSEPTHLLNEGLFTCVAMSKGGSLVVAGAKDGTVKLWDCENGKIVKELGHHNGPVITVATSEDGKHIASTAEDGSLRLWDGVSGSERCAPLYDNGSFLSCVAMSADGSRIVSGSYDNTIKSRNSENGTLLCQPFRGHAAWVRCVAMTPDGTRVVSGADDNTLRVWDGRSGENITMLYQHEGSVSSIAISADGLGIVTGSRDNGIRLWNLENEEMVDGLRQRHCDSVMCVAVSSDGRRIASGSKDKTVRLWNGENGKPVCGPLRGHDARVMCVALCANGSRVVSGSDDTTIRMWDWEGQRQLGEPLRGHEDSVRCVAVSDDGKHVVSGSRDGTLRLWDLTSTVVINAQLHGHQDWVNSVAMSPDGSTVVSSSKDRTIRLWKVSSRKVIGSPVNFNACSIWMHDGFVFARHRYFGEGKVATKSWLVHAEEGLIRCDTGYSSSIPTNGSKKIGEPKGFSWRIPRPGQSHIGAHTSPDDNLLSVFPSTLGANLAEQYSFISCSKQRVIGGQPISDEGYVLATLPAGLGISMVEQDAWFFQPTGKGTGVLAVGLRDGTVCILELVR